MRKQNQVGSTSVVFAILFGVLFAAAAGFGGWAFMGRQDYKNNSDKKSAAAVESLKRPRQLSFRKSLTKIIKTQTRLIRDPISFGTVTFNYPKTWSAYVDENTSSTPINGYFYPDKVPSTQSGSAYALRVELLNSSYTQIIRQFDSQVKQGKLRASAYVPPKMVGVANVQPGTKFDGVVSQNQTGPHTGSMVIVQVRDKTLKIYTESNNFLPDYNNIVLPSLTYVP
jgi:hypothetical protein